MDKSLQKKKSSFSKPFHSIFHSFTNLFIQEILTRHLQTGRHLPGSGFTMMNSTDSLAFWNFLSGEKNRQFKEVGPHTHIKVITVQRD